MNSQNASFSKQTVRNLTLSQILIRTLRIFHSYFYRFFSVGSCFYYRRDELLDKIILWDLIWL